jgi:acyl-CoA hydrolase
MREIQRAVGPSTLSMTVLMTPGMSNFSGKVHGGALLKLLDEVAYACASKYARSYVVTISVDRVVFLKPINVGELVTFSASVNFTGRTSLEVGIRVEAENISTGESRHTTSSYFTMVAVDEVGRPREVPALTPASEIARERFSAAQARRKAAMNTATAQE